MVPWVGGLGRRPRGSANIGERFQRLGWDDYHGDTAALEDTDGLVRAHRALVPAGVGLVLRGGLGTGKSLLAALAAKEYVRLGYSVYVVTSSEMASSRLGLGCKGEIVGFGSWWGRKIPSEVH